ncbi:ATP-binding protein [Pseudobacteroides cellulosolvens]|uniref:histidine kinase n=1 Tax=Pseudobacteroides cellulosolvens ATCC 35603 = DSM 2933 TaxID=398512 RepID=A0A0L6JI70_9FIRM|nr:ATP-binding protein [Pseudobacteroides cellulosolvens]KNY25434.1 PAS/PAC sensor signal transduction histidine kinase [Pseudobacteroides cellulosolvens ATCC 35603 = DSM 2933]
MLRLEEAIDEKIVDNIRMMSSQFLLSSTAIIEADGSYLYYQHDGPYCKYLSEIFCKSGKSTRSVCKEECLRISTESMDRKEPVEIQCCGGINIYAVPIIYKEQVIGSISAGITNPPLERSKLMDISKKYCIDVYDLVQRAYSTKRITKKESEMARLQLRMTALLISSLYENKIKQIEDDELLKRQNRLLKEKSILVEQQKEELEAIINNMSDVLMVFDEDGKYILLNKAADSSNFASSCKCVGDSYKPGIYYDTDGKELQYEDLPAVRVYNGESIKEQIVIIKTPEGEKSIGVSGTPLLDESGKMRLGIMCVRDITETINQYKTIKLQRNQLEAIFETLQDRISIFDKEGRFLLKSDLHPVKYKTLDYNVRDSAKYIVFSDVEGNPLPDEEMCHYKLFKGEKVKSGKIRTFNDKIERYFDISGVPIFDENNQFHLGVMLTTDITETIKLANEIKQQKERLEAIVNSMSNGLVILDSEFKVELLNKSAREIFIGSDENGKDSGFQKSNKYYIGIDGKKVEKSELNIQKIIDIGSFQNVIMTILRPDKKIYVSMNGGPIYDNDGVVREVILCVRDITEQVMLDNAVKYQQDELLKVEREKNAALENSINIKDEFLTTISHEFKTPLTVINSAIQAMELICKDDLSDKAKNFLNKIRQNTFRQLRLVNNLLDVTKIGAGGIKLNKRNHDIILLTRSITESVNLYALQKGIKLSFVTSLKKKVIGLDEENYERIMLNLLSNAIKYTSSGGKIEVSIKARKGNVIISVKDTGFGIPRDKQEMVFERFTQVDNSFTRQAEGTGIGLALVKMLVEALDGCIHLKSREYKGSVFTIILPSAKVEGGDVCINRTNTVESRLINAIAVEFSDIYHVNNPKAYNISNNHQKVQKLLERDAITKAICSELNSCIDLKTTLRTIMYNIKQMIKCEAIAIRLYNGGDYPYYVYKGFPEQFIKLDSSLCGVDKHGKRQKSMDGKHYILECVCGKVLNGDTDSAFSFFTNGGSFWTNSASSLTDTEMEAINSCKIRKYCIERGYESIALIPIRSKERIIGLIQMNDTRKNIYSEDMVEYLEILGENIGLAVENSLINDKLKKLV